jgi:Ankyrin repeats (many copies)
VLFEHGTDANAQDEDKSTSLHWALEDRQVEFPKVLLENGADASVRNKNKSTPLRLALPCLCNSIFTGLSARASRCKYFEVALVLLERVVTSTSIAKPGTVMRQKPKSTKLVSRLPKSTPPKDDFGMSHTMAIIELASLQDNLPLTEQVHPIYERFGRPIE